MAQIPVPHADDYRRLTAGDLFVHSPTPLTPALRKEIEHAGEVRFIIGPNRIAPRIREPAKERIAFEGIPLAARLGYPGMPKSPRCRLPGAI